MKFVMSERDEKLDQIREKCEPAKTEKKKNPTYENTRM